MDSPDPSVRLRAGAPTPGAATERARATMTVVWAGTLGGTAVVPVLAGGLDDAVAAVAPTLVASVPGLADHTVAPRSLADLRPDRMARSLPAARALRDLADRDAEGADARALADTGAPDAWVHKALAHRQASEAPSAVDRLMRLAGPASLRDEVDAELARAERALADDPEVAGLERSWRSLAWLARRLDLRGGVRLVAVTGASLDALLDGPALAQTASRASLVVVDAHLGPSPRDVERAGRLARLGASAGVPVLASAAPDLVGADGRHGPVPPVRHTADAAFAGWVGLRGRPEARALALAFPDVRLVPGRDLWAGGALAVAADAAAAWSRGDGLPGLGRRPVPDLAADDLAATLSPEQVADLASAGLGALAPSGTDVVVRAAPSAATGGGAAREAALSLPAALFAARLRQALDGSDDPGSALARELDGWGRLETDADGLRAVLPAAATPVLRADVGVRLGGP